MGGSSLEVMRGLCEGTQGEIAKSKGHLKGKAVGCSVC